MFVISQFFTVRVCCFCIQMLRRERDEERDNLNALLNDQLPTLAGSLSIQAPEPPVLSPTECRPVIPSLPHALQHRAIAQWYLFLNIPLKIYILFGTLVRYAVKFWLFRLRSCIRKISRLLQFKTESARKKSALFVIETINTLTEHVSEVCKVDLVCVTRFGFLETCDCLRKYVNWHLINHHFWSHKQPLVSFSLSFCYLIYIHIYTYM